MRRALTSLTLLALCLSLIVLPAGAAPVVPERAPVVEQTILSQLLAWLSAPVRDLVAVLDQLEFGAGWDPNGRTAENALAGTTTGDGPALTQ